MFIVRCMRKRSSITKPRSGLNKTVIDFVQEVASDQGQPTIGADAPSPKKNPAAVALGRLGGKKGGPARAAKLSAKRRREIAKKAAKARWGAGIKE
jgi:hypothetical protein